MPYSRACRGQIQLEMAQGKYKGRGIKGENRLLKREETEKTALVLLSSVGAAFLYGAVVSRFEIGKSDKASPKWRHLARHFVSPYSVL